MYAVHVVACLFHVVAVPVHVQAGMYNTPCLFVLVILYTSDLHVHVCIYIQLVLC